MSNDWQIVSFASIAPGARFRFPGSSVSAVKGHPNAHPNESRAYQVDANPSAVRVVDDVQCGVVPLTAA